MSSVSDMPALKASKATVFKANRSIPGIKIPDHNNNSEVIDRKFDYSRLNNDRPQT